MEFRLKEYFKSLCLNILKNFLDFFKEMFLRFT
jgi:hypothetical protein